MREAKHEEPANASEDGTIAGDEAREGGVGTARWAKMSPRLEVLRPVRQILSGFAFAFACYSWQVSSIHAAARRSAVQYYMCITYCLPADIQLGRRRIFARGPEHERCDAPVLSGHSDQRGKGLSYELVYRLHHHRW